MKSSNTGPGSKPASVSDSRELERTEAVRWWRRYKDAPLDDAPGQVNLPQALHDVSVMALAHMARRLSSRATPAKVKDRIALSLGPKVFIHAHAAVGTPADEAAQDLLSAYEPAAEAAVEVLPGRKLDS